MFLMAGRTGFVLQHVSFVKRMPCMASLALSIDRIERYPILETIAHHCGKLIGR